ncbi:MAG: hypothetical protein IT537_19280 [Hyphomicrobiales bacterium]|nr:hypothetical protein [Hyphomicrobiales bacterium]
MVASATLSLGCVASAESADIVAAQPAYLSPVSPPSWRVDITPYFWMPSLKGTSGIKQHTTDIDATFFGDLIHRKIPKELFGAMAAFEARNDRFAILGDFTYVLVGGSKSGVRVFTPAPIATLAVNASLDASVQMIVAELAAAYELMRWGSAPGAGVSIDIFGGGRLWWQQAEASLNVNATLALALPQQTYTISGHRAVAKSGEISWVDPMVGMRLRAAIAPGHELTVSGDVGGFDVGSKFSWQAVGAYRWQFAQSGGVTWSGMLG